VAEDRDALLKHYRQTRADMLAAIYGLSDEQLTEPSLDGWSVKDHLAHIALWDDIRAAEVARISAGHDSAWRMTEEQDESLNMMTHGLRQRFRLNRRSGNSRHRDSGCSTLSHPQPSAVSMARSMAKRACAVATRRSIPSGSSAGAASKASRRAQSSTT
jgi:uncharacterized damage-inducible protein DinB